MHNLAGDNVICICCKLQQRAEYSQYGVKERVCAHCKWHQGDRIEKRISRAESHEKLLRERLDRCQTSEATAQRELQEAKEQVRSALGSRGRLAEELVTAAARCRNTCAVPRCITSEVQRWAQQWRDRNERSPLP